MNIRRVSMGIAVAAAGRGPALAQQQDTVAKLADLEGNVLVSQGDAMVAGTANGQRVAVGTRVVTTAGAKVTISYDVGCDVRLKENERFTVNIGACARVARGGRSRSDRRPAPSAVEPSAAGGTATALSASGAAWRHCGWRGGRE